MSKNDVEAHLVSARLEEARRKQAAAMERARLATEEAKRSNKPPEQVSEATFVAHARVGKDAADRERLFATYDTDGRRGLSGRELEAMYAVAGDVPLAQASGDVLDQIVDPSLTKDELLDAAGEVRDVADVDAIMAAATDAGHGPETQAAVLERMIEKLGKDWDEPFTEAYARIGEHYTRLGDPGRGAAVAKLGDPAMRDDVRDQLNDALEDDHKTEKDLRMALEEVRTPAELDAVVAVAAAQGVDLGPLWKGMVEALDAEEATPALCAAIAAHCPDAGIATGMQALADPAVGEEVRGKLLDMLNGDFGLHVDPNLIKLLPPEQFDARNQAGAFEAAMDAATSDAERAAIAAVADVAIAPGYTDRLAAEAAIGTAQARYDAAKEAMDDANQTLALAMAAMEGMPDDAKNDFFEAFRKEHEALYDELDAARAQMADAIETHRDAVVAMLSGGTVVGAIEAEAFEDAMRIASESPEAMDLVAGITTELMEGIEAMPDDRRELIAEELMPKVFQAELERYLGRDRDNPDLAIEAFEKSPFFEAVSVVQDGLKLKDNVKKFMSGYEDIKKVLAEGYQATTAAKLESIIKRQPKAMSTAMASVGIVMGVMKIGDQGSFGAEIKNLLGITGDAAKVTEAVGKALGKFGTSASAKVLSRIGPAAQAILGTVETIGKALDGDAEGAVVAGIGAALSAAAALAPVPGLNVAAAIYAVGVMLWQSGKAEDERRERLENIGRVMDEAGFDPGLRDFLLDPETEAGAYARAKESFGLSDRELQALVAGDRSWRFALDDAAFPEVAAFVTGQVPGQDVAKTLDRLDAGLSRKDMELMAYMIKVASVPALFGETDTPEAKAMKAFGTYTSWHPDTAFDYQAVMRRLNEVLGFEFSF